MMDKIIKTDDSWYQKLIIDLKSLVFKKIVIIKHAIGKRIIEDELKFERAKYGKKTIKNLAEDLEVSKSDLYWCIQFAKKYPEISNILENHSWLYITKYLLPEHPKEPKRPDWLRIYNIWNLGKIDSDEDFFGIFPSVFMKNIIYYHTEEDDLIYDPFAGSGTTIDICREMNRRFYCSDLIVYPGRKDIKKWDIKNGLPKDLEKPDFVFLDPPYWKQAKGKYSNLETDLANMELDKFYDILHTFLRILIEWKVKKIAIIIAATQYPNINHEFEDHIFKFNEMFSSDYKVEMRYVIPYSTQQYNANQVEIMKGEKKAINLIRDLVIWTFQEE